MKIFGAESLLIIQLMFGGEVIEQIPVQKFSDSRMCEQRLYSRAHDSYRMNLLIKYKKILFAGFGSPSVKTLSTYFKGLLLLTDI